LKCVQEENKMIRKNSVVFVVLLILLLSILGCSKSKLEYPRTWDLLKFWCMDGKKPHLHYRGAGCLCERTHSSSKPGYMAHFYGEGKPDRECWAGYVDIEYIPDKNEMIFRWRGAPCESEWNSYWDWLHVYEGGEPKHLIFEEWITRGVRQTPWRQSVPPRIDQAGHPTP
jgi:hypothetical protein